MSDPFAAALDAIPEGASEGCFEGRRWSLVKTSFNGGRSVKLEARELGGKGYVSLNHYRLAGGDLLRPCELPEAQARAFVLGVDPRAPA